MKIYRPCCVCLVVLACASVALAANDIWDGNVMPPIPPSGLWGANLNWADNTTPGNSDTATFNLPFAYTVTFNANPLAIQALTVTDTVANFTSSGGARALSGGVVSTGIGTLTINATGTVNIGNGVTNTGRLNANGDVTIDGGTLTRDAGSTFALADGKTMTIEKAAPPRSSTRTSPRRTPSTIFPGPSRR